MMKKILLCVATALVLAADVQGTTYYVKKGGNDNSNGTSWATAWATLSKVNSTLAVCTRPTLSLNNSSDPDPQDVLVYDFQVYSDSQLVNLVANATKVTQGQSITSWQVNSELPDESWYWWRARSFDGTCYSNWSEKSKFYYVEARQISYGDLDHDGTIDVSDIVFLINYVFYDGSAPQPIRSGDVNADHLIDIADVVYLINYLFESGPVPKGGCNNQNDKLVHTFTSHEDRFFRI